MQPVEVRTEAHQDFGPHTYGGPKNVTKFMQRNPLSVAPLHPRLPTSERGTCRKVSTNESTKCWAHLLWPILTRLQAGPNPRPKLPRLKVPTSEASQSTRLLYHSDPFQNQKLRTPSPSTAKPPSPIVDLSSALLQPCFFIFSFWITLAPWPRLRRLPSRSRSPTPDSLSSQRLLCLLSCRDNHGSYIGVKGARTELREGGERE
ncbi:hypothetical protein ACFX13_020189 [Malus domestica]